MKNLSIQTKIMACLVLVAALVVSSSVAYTYYSERKLAFDMIAEQTQSTANFYLDNLNMWMVLDEMADRDILQDKMLEQPGIIEARILRTELLDSEWGEGFEDQYPQDEIDERALAGEDLTIVNETPEGRTLTRAFPIPGIEVYRGTECLGCHEEVTEEGQILGAIRVTYSLTDFDQRILGNIGTSAAILIGLFGAGLLVVFFALNRLMTRPLRSLSNTLSTIEENSDLTQRVSVRAQDEVGIVGQSCNSMMAKFQGSLQAVHTGIARVHEDSQRITQVSEETRSAVVKQNDGTALVVNAMEQMNIAASEVMNSANTTRIASEETDRLAHDSLDVMESAIATINNLAGEIDKVAQVILRVGDQGEKVGTVLEVINGVAEQTNLLALNAAIEAARAGDQGRGFAVVADEVRTLANKTHSHTREIKAMIDSLQGETHQAMEMVEPSKDAARQGVEEAQRAVDALRNIVDHVAEIKRMNDSMASASDEQNSIAEEINRNVRDIGEISQGTSARADEALNVSRQLGDQANRLDELINRFKLDN